MDFKKKCVNFKKNAKEFGYNLKLTHVQELLAKYEGFENRHAFLAKKKETKIKKTEKKKDEYFYEIHVFYSSDEGYSVGFRSLEDLSISGEPDYDAILEKASEVEILAENGDYKQVDYIREIDRKEWEFFTNHNKNKTECQTCHQYFDNEYMVQTPNSRLDKICTTCYDKEIKINISTDDGFFHYVETYIDKEYIEWALEENKGFIEMLLDGEFGPDSHTDPLLHDTESPTAKHIAEYVSIINSNPDREGTGYSVYIDEDSFNKWKDRNRRRLSDLGFNV